jgi:hypothetical protein
MKQSLAKVLVDAINERNLLNAAKFALYANARPLNSSLATKECYGVLSIEDREHAKTLRSMTQLSRVTYKIVLYSKSLVSLSEYEFTLDQIVNQMRGVVQCRFRILNMRKLPGTSDDKEETPERDRQFRLSKTITFFSDVKEAVDLNETFLTVGASHLPSVPLSISLGGTSATTATEALNNLLPSQTGNTGYVLTTDGAGTVTWEASSSPDLTNYLNKVSLTEETVTADVNFTGIIKPNNIGSSMLPQSSLYSLGSLVNKWRRLYLNDTLFTQKVDATNTLDATYNLISVTGHASQSGDYIRCLDSSSNVFFQVKSDKSILIDTDTTVTPLTTNCAIGGYSTTPIALIRNFDADRIRIDAFGGLYLGQNSGAIPSISTNSFSWASITCAETAGDKIYLYSNGGQSRWGFGIAPWAFTMFMDAGNPGVGRFSWRNTPSGFPASAEASSGVETMNLYTTGMLENILNTVSAVGHRIILTAGQTGDAIRVEDSSNVTLSRINKDGYIITKKNSAPADGDLNANELALWFDSSNGAAKLKLKGKTADGTVVTGEVALA